MKLAACLSNFWCGRKVFLKKFVCGIKNISSKSSILMSCRSYLNSFKKSAKSKILFIFLNLFNSASAIGLRFSETSRPKDLFMNSVKVRVSFSVTI